MRYRSLFTIALLSATLLFFSLRSQKIEPQEKIRMYYHDGLVQMVNQLKQLQTAIETGQDSKRVHNAFLQSRLAYKKIELLLEYYFGLDAGKFNGPPVDFIEEEDPTALQEPQGFQVIESLLYPQCDKSKKETALLYISKLLTLTNGLAGNSSALDPESYAPDAAMEELYRILALGITGFDSPAAHYSLQEAKSSLESIGFIIETYKEAFTSHGQWYNECRQLLQSSVQYLNNHTDFNSFNRMEFITRFLNPLCNVFANMKAVAGFVDNPRRYCLIKKSGHLFKKESLLQSHYLYDDTITAARIMLGKKLFYEPQLSADGKRACSNCHQPGKAFTDGLPKALQVNGHDALPRNTPTLWNAYLQMNLFYDSRQKRLDNLVMEVLSNEKEMNSGAEKGVALLTKDTSYNRLFLSAYPGKSNTVSAQNMVNAIAMYLRTLTSYNARFDRYMRGGHNEMNESEIRGFNLFTGKAKCATCHYVPFFNGSKPPLYYYQESEVIGVPASGSTVHITLDNDKGRGPVLQRRFMDHAFKTPTLRNIALTAPYMHNGVYKTLEEVIDFYDKGGGRGLGINLPNQTLPAEKLHLTLTEKRQLIAFLGTLTDTSASR